MSAISNEVISPYDLPPVPYFDRKSYLRSEFQEGVIRTELGRRLIVLPEEMLKGIHQAVEYETGRAWNLVTYLCGRRWGERLLVTVRDEWRHYHRTAVDHVDFEFFEQWLKGYFAFHGWGDLTVDFSWERQGLVQFRLNDSILDKLLQDLPGGFVNEIFAGLLASWVSWFSGTELECLEIESPHAGGETARFAIGLRPRIEAARKVRAAGASTEEITVALMQVEEG